MIPFNIPPYVGTEMDFIQQAIASHKICISYMFKEPDIYTVMAPCTFIIVSYLSSTP